MITGKNLINGVWVDAKKSIESADLNGLRFAQATKEQVDEACQAAANDFRQYASTSREQRAAFLHSITEFIDAIGDEITATAMQETGLPEARLVGERARTTGQLRMFAELIKSTDYLDQRHDVALPERTPLPRPDLQLSHRAIGPVAVFGASNFPLAFSTAGGDTASALAAGCPVIVKGHGAHAGTADLVAQAIYHALENSGMPKATFQIVQGSGREVGTVLVQHPKIRAVGFTGSLAGGRALYDLCHSRVTPIPFYGELGSINPTFCLPKAMNFRADKIASGWVSSLTMGAGQFCTNPGVVVMLEGSDAECFESASIKAMQASKEQKMLTDNICEAYQNGVRQFSQLMAEVASVGKATKPRHALPALFKVSASDWMANPSLQHEVFGAAGIMVLAQNVEEMLSLAESLEGQLTTTIFYDAGDLEVAKQLVPTLEEKSGRILCNGYPTGVEVCSAMMHGGPYPASTDVRSTSVGTLAINRWLRPVSYQNMPSELLPADCI